MNSNSEHCSPFLGSVISAISLNNVPWNNETWDQFQYPVRRLILRSHEVTKPSDWQFELSYRSEIWQAHRQQCCRGACQISEWTDNSIYISHSSEISRDLTIRHLILYWNRTLIVPLFLDQWDLTVLLFSICLQQWPPEKLARPIASDMSFFVTAPRPWGNGVMSAETDAVRMVDKIATYWHYL